MNGIAHSLRLLHDRRGFFGLLLCLYFGQGLPSGLIAHALPALLLHPDGAENRSLY